MPEQPRPRTEQGPEAKLMASVKEVITAISNSTLPAEQIRLLKQAIAVAERLTLKEKPKNRGSDPTIYEPENSAQKTLLNEVNRRNRAALEALGLTLDASWREIVQAADKAAKSADAQEKQKVGTLVYAFLDVLRENAVWAIRPQFAKEAGNAQRFLLNGEDRAALEKLAELGDLNLVEEKMGSRGEDATIWRTNRHDVSDYVTPALRVPRDQSHNPDYIVGICSPIVYHKDGDLLTKGSVIIAR